MLTRVEGGRRGGAGPTQIVAVSAARAMSEITDCHQTSRRD